MLVIRSFYCSNLDSTMLSMSVCLHVRVCVCVVSKRCLQNMKLPCNNDHKIPLITGISC